VILLLVLIYVVHKGIKASKVHPAEDEDPATTTAQVEEEGGQTQARTAASAPQRPPPRLGTTSQAAPPPLPVLVPRSKKENLGSAVATIADNDLSIGSVTSDDESSGFAPGGEGIVPRPAPPLLPTLPVKKGKGAQPALPPPPPLPK
jgi:hypothetical protein